MKVIGYIRVSTEDQAKEGISLEAQQARIKTYCSAKGWKLVGIEADRGISAKDCNRPGLQAVLDTVKGGGIDALVVYKLDRLTRSIADLLELMKLLNKYEVGLVSMEESLDATTATGRAMMSMLAVFNQLEREMACERTKMVMSYLKEQHKVHSRPVYGYDNRQGKLYANKKEQAVIQQATTLRAQGRSYRAIAAELNTTNVPTKRGGQWAAMTVRGILRRAIV